MKRARTWMLRMIPLPILLHPADFLLVFLMGLAGIPYVLGLTEPRSFTETMPFWTAQVWGGALTAGALLLACGLTSVTQQQGRLFYRRVACYRLGLRLMLSSSLLYAGLILWGAGLSGVTAAASTLLLSGYCGIRLLVISKAEQ